MVIDFKAVKDIGLNDFFDSFDHSVMLWDEDPRSKIIGQINPKRHLVVPFNPTAEMIAKSCFLVAESVLKTAPRLSDEKDVKVFQMIVHETDTGYAVFRAEDLKNDRFPPIQFSKWIISEGIQSTWKNQARHENLLRDETLF